MARKKKTKKIQPGAGAKATILTKCIHPKQNNPDKQHRSNVVLVSREEKMVNRKQQVCFTFTVDGLDDNLYAVKKHFVLVEEGPKDDLFDESGPDDDRTDTENVVEKGKWRKSKAKKLLYQLLMDGTIPMEDSMPLEDIYSLNEEFAKWEYRLLKPRLTAIRKKIVELDNRAEADLAAFENYKKNHQPSLHSHKGYVQWQGSTAQDFLLDDLQDFIDNPNMKPKDLWLSRDEYNQQFPLHAFRDKIYQEIRTAKYLRTMKARDEGEDV